MNRKIGIIGLALVFALVNVLAVEGQEIPAGAVYQREYRYLRDNETGGIFKAKLINVSASEKGSESPTWLISPLAQIPSMLSKGVRSVTDKDTLAVWETNTTRGKTYVTVDWNSNNGWSTSPDLRTFELVGWDEHKKYDQYFDYIDVWWKNVQITEDELKKLTGISDEPNMPSGKTGEWSKNANESETNEILDILRGLVERPTSASKVKAVVREYKDSFTVHLYNTKEDINENYTYTKESGEDYSDKTYVLDWLKNSISEDSGISEERISISFAPKETPTFDINAMLPSIAVVLLLAIALYIVYDRWRKR